MCVSKQIKSIVSKRQIFIFYASVLYPYAGPFFMKLRILGDIHKICISGKIFAFHRSTKDILEHLLF